MSLEVHADLWLRFRITERTASSWCDPRAWGTTAAHLPNKNSSSPSGTNKQTTTTATPTPSTTPPHSTKWPWTSPPIHKSPTPPKCITILQRIRKRYPHQRCLIGRQNLLSSRRRLLMRRWLLISLNARIGMRLRLSTRKNWRILMHF